MLVLYFPVSAACVHWCSGFLSVCFIRVMPIWEDGCRRVVVFLVPRLPERQKLPSDSFGLGWEGVGRNRGCEVQLLERMLPASDLCLGSAGN
jgi:hypothetical protein